MYYLVAEALELPANAVLVTQAVALGDHNAAQIRFSVEEASATLTTPGVVLLLEESDDLENWRATGVTTNVGSAPSCTDLAPTSGLFSRFVRLRLTGANVPTLVSATINTVTYY